MPEDELDATTIAEYRKVLDEAAAQLGAGAGQRVAGATAAVFTALDRRDYELRELLAIVRALADLPIVSGEPPALVALIERARTLTGGRT
jgi:hypothetical protein